MTCETRSSCSQQAIAHRHASPSAQASPSPLIEEVCHATDRLDDINNALRNGWIQATPCVRARARKYLRWSQSMHGIPGTGDAFATAVARLGSRGQLMVPDRRDAGASQRPA